MHNKSKRALFALWLRSDSHNCQNNPNILYSDYKSRDSEFKLIRWMTKLTLMTKCKLYIFKITNITFLSMVGLPAIAVSTPTTLTVINFHIPVVLHFGGVIVRNFWQQLKSNLQSLSWELWLISVQKCQLLVGFHC